jgi:hypothetical protein
VPGPEVPPPPKDPKRWLYFAIGFGGVLGLFAAGLCVWLIARGAAAPQKPMTRKQLEDLVMGADLDTVRQRLGAPGLVSAPVGVTGLPNPPAFGGYWQYDDLTRNPDTGRAECATLWISWGKICRVTYD